jgi:hypothetical protein
MGVSSLPKAAQNWALFVTHQIAIKISGENVAFCSPEPRWLQRPSEVRRGDKAARRTPAAGPGKAENDWLPAGQGANVCVLPGEGMGTTSINLSLAHFLGFGSRLSRNLACVQDCLAPKRRQSSRIRPYKNQP